MRLVAPVLVLAVAVAGCSSARPPAVAAPGASVAARARAPVRVVRTPTAATPQIAARPASPPAYVAGVTEAQGAGHELSGFGKALLEYSTWIDQYAVLPVDQKSDALHQAFDALAAALQVLPFSTDLAPAQVAGNLRTLSSNFLATKAFSPEQTTIARDLFDRTQSFLALVAQQKYAGAPPIVDAVDAVRTQYQAIDTSASLDQQLSVVLACLASIEMVFRAMGLAATEVLWNRSQPATAP